MRFFLDISYDGSSFHGWQKQPETTTIQGTIENHLSILFQKPVLLTGAGRTDAGVHARQLIAHVDLDSPTNIEDLRHRLNSFLPNSIAINSIIPVKENAHARFDALTRTYEYKINWNKNPFLIKYSYYLKHKLMIDPMNTAASILLDYKDFKCFSKSKTDVKTYNCKIIKAEWIEKNGELIFFIKADRFLRNMVRAIVGTLLEIGTGKLNEADFHTIIKSKDRSKAGFSVPAHGLYLKEITYPKSIYL